MLTLERQNEMLLYLKEHKSATILELSNKFFIGAASIRRDLEKLEKKKLINRTYGGAVLIEGLNEEIPIGVREKERSDAKEIIGQLAASFVKDNDIIIIDSSTTSHHMIKHLKNKQNLTVVTNGIRTATTLGETLHSKTYCCGGKLRENSLSLVGDQSKRFISNYSVQKLFFSCRALSMELGAIDASDDEAELRRTMINSSDEVFLLCDSNKFDKKAFYQICQFNQINYVITETRPSDAWLAMLKQCNVNIIYK